MFWWHARERQTVVAKGEIVAKERETELQMSRGLGIRLRDHAPPVSTSSVKGLIQANTLVDPRALELHCLRW